MPGSTDQIPPITTAWTDIFLRQVYGRARQIAQEEITLAFGQQFRGGKLDGVYIGGTISPSTLLSAFVTIGNDASLPNERALTQGTHITVVDGGANSTVTINAIAYSDLTGSNHGLIQDDGSGGVKLNSLQLGSDVVLNHYGTLEMGFANGNGFRVSDFALDSNGYRVTGPGAGYFRYLYASEFHAKSFIADLEQALAGSQLIGKSVAPLAADFTAPAAGATANLVVQEFQGFGAFHVFVDGDFINVRQFSRSGSSLTIGDCWGTVAYYSRDPSAQTQTYVFTRRSGTIGAGNAPGSVAATTVIGRGTLSLDLGTSGNGYIESVAQSGAMASGVPFQQIVTWVTEPGVTGNRTVRTRIGNLKGIFGISADVFGAAFGDYPNNYLRYEPSGGFVVVAGGGAVVIDSTGIAIGAGNARANLLEWYDFTQGFAPAYMYGFDLGSPNYEGLWQLFVANKAGTHQEALTYDTTSNIFDVSRSIRAGYGRNDGNGTFTGGLMVGTASGAGQGDGFFSGHVGVGTSTTGAEYPFSCYQAGTDGHWYGRGIFGNQNYKAILGTYADKVVIGAHNAALNAWADLHLNTPAPGSAGGNTYFGGTIATVSNVAWDLKGYTALGGTLSTTGYLDVVVASTTYHIPCST